MQERNKRKPAYKLLLGTGVLLIIGAAAVWGTSTSDRFRPFVIGPDGYEEKLDESQPVRLKVAYEQAEGFMTRYGKAFTLRYPHVSFEVVTAPPGEDMLSILKPEGALRMLDEEKVDLVWMNAASYEQIAATGRLASLEGWVMQNPAVVEEMDPAIMSSMRQRSDGQLYGLPLEVDRHMLFYNTAMFEAYGVPLPTERMSWDDVLQLAARFPVKDNEGRPLYGLSASIPSSPGALIEMMGQTKRLQLVDPQQLTFTLQTPGWQAVWELALDRFGRSTVLWDESPAGSGAFVQNHAAMVVDVSGLLGRLLRLDVPFAWDVVPEPIDPAYPDASATFDIPYIAAIRAQSPHQAEARAFLKLINSKTMVQKLAWTTEMRLLPQKQIWLERAKASRPDVHFDAFYALEPGMPVADPLLAGNWMLRRMIRGWMDEAAKQVMREGVPLEEALHMLQLHAEQQAVHLRSSEQR